LRPEDPYLQRIPNNSEPQVMSDHAVCPHKQSFTKKRLKSYKNTQLAAEPPYNAKIYIGGSVARLAKS